MADSCKKTSPPEPDPENRKNRQQKADPGKEPLLNAVRDLLCELRIDDKSLETMARGYSPDYPGVSKPGRKRAQCSPVCKVQLSQVVAAKLPDAGVNESSGRKFPSAGLE